MTGTVRDPVALLLTFAALPPEQRLDHLRAHDDPKRTLLQLIDEANRQVAVEAAHALDASELVVTLATEFGGGQLLARALRARVNALAHVGRYADALPVVDAATTVAEGAGDRIEAARLRLAAVHPLSVLARYDEAIAAGEAARATFAAVGEDALAARADISLGATHDARDDPTTALFHFDRARAALTDEPALLAQLETNRGVALTGTNDFAGAQAAFEAAVAAFEAEGMPWAAAIAEGNLAYLAARQGRLERALRHFERARRCLEGDEAAADVARLLAEQADVLAAIGLVDDALAAYEDAVPVLVAHGLASEAAEARVGLGRVLSRLARFDEAEEALAAAVADFGRLHHPTSGARVDLVRAELAVARGRPDEAEALIEDALGSLADRPVEVATARYRRGMLALDAGNVAAAHAELAPAVAIAERLDLAPLLADVLHARGLAHRSRGNDAAAVADLRAAVEQVERVRGALQAERFRAAFLGNRLAVYEDLVRLTLDGGGATAVADAFETVERAKSRALLDLVGGALDLAETAPADPTDPGEAALHAEATRLRVELNWLYSRLAEEDPLGHGGLAAAEWAGKVRDRERELDALGERLAAARETAGLHAPPVNLVGALRLVPLGSALVEYFLAGDEVLAFVLRDGRADVVRRLATAVELADRVRRLHFQINRAVVGGDRGAGRAERMLTDARRELGALHATLLAPLRSAIEGAERLIVVPHGPLHTVPFHALWSGDDYLIERHEVVVVPSASLLAQLPNGSHQPSVAAAVVVGVPDDVAPRMGEEAERVARTLGTERLFLGSAATVEAISRAAGEADVLHLACHGRFSADSPLASGLRLADRWLTVRDVYGLRLPASLVTLSGCDTGRSAIDHGDELAGLMRGFFAAGTRTLVVTLWTTNDAGATELMTQFYETWRGGASIPAALRSAQRSLLARLPHPAYWAPFFVGGNP